MTRLLRLLHTLANNPDGLTLAELKESLISPKSSLVHLLRPLVADGHVSRSDDSYRLGPSAFRLAAHVMSAWNFSKLSRTYLEELATRSRESVYIGVLDREAQVITSVDAIESSHSIRYAMAVGTNRPLYCTAAGRVVLAYADTKFRREYLRSLEVARAAEHIVIDIQALQEKLEHIRRTQLSISVSELFQGSAAIAAPIFGADGQMIAALAIGAPADRFEADFPRLREIICDVASRLSGAQHEPISVENSTEPCNALASRRTPPATASPKSRRPPARA